MTHQVPSTPFAPLPRPVTPLGIAVRQLEQIVAQAKAAHIPDALLGSIQQTYDLVSGIESYLELCSTPESTALSNLAQKTAAEDWIKCFSDRETILQLEQEMLSGHLEGQFLKLIVQMTQAEQILEVGMFTGYSALAMAEALPESGQIIACEVDAYVACFAQDCFAHSPHGHKITVKVAPALDTLEQLVQGGQVFDLVFIDADKTEYIDYFQIILDNGLLKTGGVILVDNTLLQGQPYLPETMRTANGEAIAQFNQVVAADPRVEQVLLPIRDGLTLIRRQ